MKVDNLNGPLFVEVNFFIRVISNANANVKNFMEEKGLDYLGIPRFIASGTDTIKSGSYRYLVMELLGEELQSVLEKHRLSISVTSRIACRIIGMSFFSKQYKRLISIFSSSDALEFIHNAGYIHADIKAQNILRLKSSQSTAQATPKNKRASKRTITDSTVDNEILEDDKYVLIDFGLADRFMFQGNHKNNEIDKRKANNGTCEFRSRDAHLGVISRRSDIESFGYSLILWFYGRHPWENLLKNADQVLEKKNWAMDHIDLFLKEAFSDKPINSGLISDSKASSSKSKTAEKETAVRKRTIPINTTVPKGLNKFFEAVKALEYNEKPDYDKLRSILRDIGRLNGNQPTYSNGVNSNGKKTRNPATPKAPRLSTPLICMTPPDGGESPLFGPFEVDDSIKENQLHLNHRISSAKKLNNVMKGSEEGEEARKLRSPRIFIDSKPRRPAKRTAAATTTSNGAGTSKKTATATTNGKKSATSALSNGTAGNHSSSTPARGGSSNGATNGGGTNGGGVMMTAAMLKIRQKIADRKTEEKKKVVRKTPLKK